jgi:aryl-phospho-beta-D-glucosidase BglC (GH1 family)
MNGVLTLFLAAAIVAPKPNPNLHVEGNQLVENGQVVRLQGLNVPSLEWSNTGEFVFRSARVALEEWNANCVRLPLSQDRWFGRAEGQKDKGQDYQDTVAEVVNLVTNRKGYVVLDLHWSNAGEWGKRMAQHKMPDQHSAAFWKDLAGRYRGNPRVLFDLYNEPRDVDWKTWRDGGTVTEDGVTYQSPGMQGLVDTIRKRGAKNVIIAGGLDWGYDLTGILNGYALKDPNVVYSAHIYPWKTEWEQKVGRVADTYPVFIGEVGAEPDPKQEDPAIWAPKVLNYIEKRKLHWAAWCFHPSASPRMLVDWSYKPTPYWGQPVKEALAKRN